MAPFCVFPRKIEESVAGVELFGGSSSGVVDASRKGCRVF
jgi:hypothetical protein